jgi:diaminopimelate epimerase
MVDARPAIAGALAGIPFTKMTGSGNDFVIFDGRRMEIAAVTTPEVIRAICHRNNGIGADGVVILSPAATGEILQVQYFNRDGTRGELCGNATLCSTALAVASGLAAAQGMTLETDAGRVHARIAGDAPEIDLAGVDEVVDDATDRVPLIAGERRVGFARVGVPHIVIQVADEAALGTVDVSSRGRSIRQSVAMQPSGTNVNWVAPRMAGGWAYRTYERGVEDETLACGTGAVAAAILLSRWGHGPGPHTLHTRSGRPVTVRFRSADAAGPSGSALWYPSLRGEGRVVFTGVLAGDPPRR